MSNLRAQRRIDSRNHHSWTRKEEIIPDLFWQRGVLKGVLADLNSILACQIELCVYNYFRDNLAHCKDIDCFQLR
jgi:hypothetical protein